MRPIEALDLKVALAEWWRYSPHARGFVDQMRATGVNLHEPGAEAQWLREAETVLVTEDMTALLEAAFVGFPHEHPFAETEVELDPGFALLARPIHTRPDDPAVPSVRAIFWLTAGEVGIPTQVHVVAYTDPENFRDAGDFVGIARPPLVSLGGTSGDFATMPSSPEVRLARTLWALMRQRIATARREAAERAGARRARRAGHFPEVSVVDLRRLKTRASSDGGAEPVDVNWSHRWIVGGHWRNQWMPSTETHEPRWIAPYVKGPEHKPLVADKVYQLIR